MKTHRNECGSQQEHEVQERLRPLKRSLRALTDYRKVNFKGHPIKAALQQTLSLLNPICCNGSIICQQVSLLKPEIGRKAPKGQTGRERLSSRHGYTDLEVREVVPKTRASHRLG